MGDFSKSLLTRLMQPVCCLSEVTGSIVPVRSVAETALSVERSFWREGSAVLLRLNRGDEVWEDLLAGLWCREENICFQCSKSFVSCAFSVRGAFISFEEDESVIVEVE